MYKIEFKNEYGVTNNYTSKFEGVINTLTRRYFDNGADKGHYDEYVIDLECTTCDGNRLNLESLGVYVENYNI